MSAAAHGDAADPRGRAEGTNLLTGFGRAIAGGLLFALPLLMTMEMWRLGFVMQPLRLALLWAVTLPLLVRLSRLGGLRDTGALRDDVADALVAVGGAFIATSLILWLFGVIGADSSAREIAGKVALQSAPASIGAMLARNQLGGAPADRIREGAPSYAGELFLMVVGALFLSLNVAPTEEVFVIAYQMSPWQQIGLLGASVALMHGFVYSLEFSGAETYRPEEGFWGVLARYTVVGYALVLLVSLYVLWSFGHTDGHGVEDVASAAIVLAFPGAIGAAAARLIL